MATLPKTDNSTFILILKNSFDYRGGAESTGAAEKCPATRSTTGTKVSFCPGWRLALFCPGFSIYLYIAYMESNGHNYQFVTIPYTEIVLLSVPLL